MLQLTLEFQRNTKNYAVYTVPGTVNKLYLPKGYGQTIHLVQVNDPKEAAHLLSPTPVPPRGDMES